MRSSACTSSSIEVVMLTGDAKAVADAVAADLGIDTVFAEVLPGRQGEQDQGAARRKASASRWSATASTMRRRC